MDVPNVQLLKALDVPCQKKITAPSNNPNRRPQDDISSGLISLLYFSTPADLRKRQPGSAAFPQAINPLSQ